MAILTKGQTFANADAVTSTKLNALVDSAAFVAGASGTTDDSTLEVNGSGRLQIKDLGVTGAKFANGTVTTAKLADSTTAADGVTYAKLQRVAAMKVIGNTTGSLAVASEVSVLDEDDMVSDSATAIPTQQSVKAYVDATAAAIVTTGTSVASTSGTAITFTGIPATAKRIYIMLAGVSTSGTSSLIARIGSGSILTTGYLGSATEIRATPQTENFTNGFGISPEHEGSYVIHGIMTLCKITGNSWVASFTGGDSSTIYSYVGGGSNSTLSGALDRVSITTVGGSNTFDAGVINITYE